MTSPDRPAPRPTDVRAFVFTDLVGSMDLKRRLGDAEGVALIDRHDALFREVLAEHDGKEENNTGDGFLASFASPSAAVRCALEFVDEIARLEAPAPLAVRAGVHLGEIPHREPNEAGGAKVSGLAVDTAARVMGLARSGQLLLTRAAFDSARQHVLESTDGSPICWLAHGAYRFQGLDDPIEIFEAARGAEARGAPPADTEKARRVVSPDDEETLGWRPAAGQSVPRREGWRLERKLGEGGFGEVWLARHETTKQPRAFKFCFRAERLRALKRELTLFRLMKETLGERPDIARLHDVHLDRPPFYLEMDFTDGGDLIDWSDRRGRIAALPIEERLEIVAQLADALAAAHSVGVIHKDVKPSNVLIEVQKDGRPQAKLTDFGIGELTAREALAEAGVTAAGFSTRISTVMSKYDSRSGTRLYLAPELQAGRPPSIQSDIYSLGVMLYQVVAGDLKRPLGQGWERDVADELLREDIAACVDVRPENRPAGAGEIARRLRSLPARRAEREETRRIEARAIRSRKRRRALAGASAAALALAVAVGAVALRENRLRRDAETARADADREAAAARRVTEFLVGVFRVSDPYGEEEWAFEEIETSGDEAAALGSRITARQLLDRGAARLDSELKDEPELRARLMQTVGRVYLNLDEFDRAEAMVNEAMAAHEAGAGPKSAAAAEGWAALGSIASGRSDHAKAEALHRRALAMREEIFGAESERAAESLNSLAVAVKNQGRFDEAEGLYRRSLSIYGERLGEESERVARVMGNLANNLRAQGKIDEAEAMLRETLRRRIEHLGEGHPSVAGAMNNLGLLLLLDRGETVESRRNLEEALAMRRARLGGDHPSIAQSLRNLSIALRRAGEFEAAETALTEALGILRERLGDEHPSVRSTLAAMERVAGEWSEAGGGDRVARLRGEILSLRREMLGEESLEVASSLESLGLTLRDQGDFARAEALFREAIEIAVKLAPAGSRRVGQALSRFNALALRLRSAGQLDDAERLNREAIDLRRRWMGEAHRDVASSLHNLALVLRDKGEFADAERAFREALAIERKTDGDRHESTRNTLDGLSGTARALTDGGGPEEGERLHREVVALFREMLGEADPEVGPYLNLLAYNLRLQGRFEDSEAVDREALAIQRAARQGPHAETAATMMNLSIVVAERGRLGEALELLREARSMYLGLGEAGARGAANALHNVRLLAGRIYAEGDAETAIATLREVASAAAGAWGADHRETMAAGRDLGAALATEGRFDEAAAVFSDAAAIGERLDARGELTPPARNDWAWTLVLLGRARRDGGDAESAREAWTKAVEVSEPLAGESAEQAHLDTRAQALIELGRLDEARPLVRRLLDGGWDDPTFLDLARKHGLIDPYNERTG